jgi:hypothetical protein
LTAIQIGGGSFQPATLTSATKLAVMVGKELNAKLMEKLNQVGRTLSQLVLGGHKLKLLSTFSL